MSSSKTARRRRRPREFTALISSVRASARGWALRFTRRDGTSELRTPTRAVHRRGPWYTTRLRLLPHGSISSTRAVRREECGEPGGDSRLEGATVSRRYSESNRQPGHDRPKFSRPLRDMDAAAWRRPTTSLPFAASRNDRQSVVCGSIQAGRASERLAARLTFEEPKRCGRRCEPNLCGSR